MLKETRKKDNARISELEAKELQLKINRVKTISKSDLTSKIKSIKFNKEYIIRQIKDYIRSSNANKARTIDGISSTLELKEISIQILTELKILYNQNNLQLKNEIDYFLDNLNN
ncbi:MAG: hypothetical protein V1824_01810 [archaeon]